jgi:acetyl-CoA synthetase
VRESAAVGLPDPIKGTRLVLVAVPRPGARPSPELSSEVAGFVASRLGSTMRPAQVLWVSALPVTRSGKILRGLIRKILAGEDAGPTTTLANPEALEALEAQRPG